MILVVDDDPVIRTLLRAALARLEPRELLEAADGEDARSLLEEHEVDLVVTDLLMPRLDGLGLIRWANEAGVSPEWIILSAVETFDAAVEAVQLGAFDFLTKPPRLEALEVSVRNALQRRRLVQEQERLISDLEQATLGLVGKVRELEEKSEALRRDLERAEVIQRALLPREPPELPGWSVNALYRPGRYVGGDLYHVARLGEDHLALLVADATGHGVSSAMMSVLFHRRLALTDASGRPLPPGTVLERVNRALCEDSPGPGVFLTTALCLMDLRRGEGVLAAAGHPPSMLRTRSGRVRHLERTGPALGLVEDARYGEVVVRLERGDRLLLYTDGLLQGVNGNGEGPWERFDSVLGNQQHRGCALLEALVEAATAASGGAIKEEDRDDVTALLLEAAPGPSCFENRPGASAATRPAPQRAEAPVLWYGEEGERCYLAVRGWGTWTEADAFYETALGILEVGRPLEVVLSECGHLDSTFLGTLHELVSRADHRVDLSGVGPAVRHEFEELGLGEVLEAVRRDRERPPDMHPLWTEAAGGGGGQHRVLRAHEALASLSSRNQEKFLAVVEALRKQVADEGT